MTKAILTLLVLGFLGAAAEAQSPATNSGSGILNHRPPESLPQKDSRIAQNILKQINADKSLSADAKNVTVESGAGGGVILRGTVGTAQEKNKLEAIARGASEGQSIDNRINVRQE
ncbi:BON domain protein [compost metagenome]